MVKMAIPDQPISLTVKRIDAEYIAEFLASNGISGRFAN